MLPIILFVLILIIAGAIARQGMLSAFLHMICVVSAGATIRSKDDSVWKV